jgi:hypothetical protein
VAQVLQTKPSQTDISCGVSKRPQCSPSGTHFGTQDECRPGATPARSPFRHSYVLATRNAEATDLRSFSVGDRSGSFVHCVSSFPRRCILVAEAGFEPTTSGYEPDEIPLLHPASLWEPGRRIESSEAATERSSDNGILHPGSIYEYRTLACRVKCTKLFGRETLHFRYFEGT